MESYVDAFEDKIESPSIENHSFETKSILKWFFLLALPLLQIVSLYDDSLEL